jgi:cytochrome c oxidase subunit I+III
LLARRCNRRDRGAAAIGSLALAVVLALAGGAALLVGPATTGLDPTTHVYPAPVWLLVLWCAFHLVVGVVMHLYCIARRLAGFMTARYDAEIGNVALYWHFTALTVVVTVAVIAGFPLIA